MIRWSPSITHPPAPCANSSSRSMSCASCSVFRAQCPSPRGQAVVNTCTHRARQSAHHRLWPKICGGYVQEIFRENHATVLNNGRGNNTRSMWYCERIQGQTHFLLKKLWYTGKQRPLILQNGSGGGLRNNLDACFFPLTIFPTKFGCWWWGSAQRLGQERDLQLIGVWIIQCPVKGTPFFSDGIQDPVSFDLKWRGLRM